MHQTEGVALLIAGQGADGTRAFDASMVHTLGQIGEAVLATGARWRVRRLRAGAGERHGADRAAIKRELDELCAEDARVAMLVVLGSIVDVGDGPALVTGLEHRAYPEDAVLPLAWIGERLRHARAEHVVVVVSARPAAAALDPEMPTERYAEGVAPRPSRPDVHADPPERARAWLATLGTGRPGDLVAADTAAAGSPLADALLGGLCGDALDPRTGTVTFRSLSEHLARAVPHAVLQASLASQTVASSPPLAGLWDVRRSQLSGTARTRGHEPEELLGTVLPGRFRIDTMVARGTFGTVYRAHQLAVDRDVAVKVLHSDIDPASDDGRLFVQEIRSVGKIDHPNVVRIHQADMTHDGRLFFAMELLDGRDLQSIASDARLPRARAIAIVRELLAGLGAAHDAGLVHADVKPANAIVIARDPLPARVVLVDFGLARLRPPDRSAESVGGTPAFMAPEQLQEGRVDARSDLFSAALVLVYLIAGWRRTEAKQLVPPDGTITDPALARVLARALAIDPQQRYQTAAELSAALGDVAGDGARPASPRPATNSPADGPIAGVAAPFRHLEPLTELDADRFYGRDRDLASLLDHAMFGRTVIYTAPSGTGKTSLLRAGLLPRLEALGITVVYVRCREDALGRTIGAIWPGATTLADALAQHRAQRRGALVLVLDQLEAALATLDPLLAELAGRGDVATVFGVREDHLARIVATVHAVDASIPILRLPPLSPEGARAAIAQPLARARLTMEPELEDALLADLQRAAVSLGRDLGWGDAPAVYPPHLQLACTVLVEALAAGDATLTLARYRALGGFDAIVGEYLERVLDTELDPPRATIARELFVALVTTNQERAAPTEAGLLEVVGARFPTPDILAVLELLRARGLLVRVRGGDGEPRWELVHDSLVPRVLAWLDRASLARKRAVELVRYHVRRSRAGAPSLLGRAELRELRGHARAITELDGEYARRDNADIGGWTPARLVARSRAVVRNRVLATGGVIAILALVAGLGLWRVRVADAAAAHEASLRARNLGRFELAFEAFDWDEPHLAAHPVALDALPALAWSLHYPSAADPDEVGVAYATADLDRPDALAGTVEARGGLAYLVIDGRGRRGERCEPSILPVQLPGYQERDRTTVVRVAVPTCGASHAGMIEIPPGEFIYGGAGVPQPAIFTANPEWMLPEQTVALPSYRIDRTEVTNARFATLTQMAAIAHIQTPAYPHYVNELANSASPRAPVAGVTWHEARAFCRFYGLDLPTHREWIKAMRGGLVLDGQPNPSPRRNFPWGEDAARASEAHLHTAGAVVGDVGTAPIDRSPYGVLDLAGNVLEWLADVNSHDPRSRVVAGGEFMDTTPAELVEYLAIRNQRPSETRLFHLGMRCVEAVRAR